MSPPNPPTDPTAAERVQLAPVHDFVRKLRQAPFHARVVDYVAWRRAVAAARLDGSAEPPMPLWAPLSINLDLTTACNFACDHCIDWETLNSGISYDDRQLRTSLAEMRARGLRSVILIGGGEPTVYPGFVSVVGFLKDLGLQVAVVSNGSRNERILEIIERLDENDWVRLSLDAGTDATFQALHKPKKPVSLDEICDWIPRIKARNPRPRIGFSYVICWNGAERGPSAPPVVENIAEVADAAARAKAAGFDYISFKPFLTRTPEGAEVMDPDSVRADLARTLERIAGQLVDARAIATDRFAVVESTNLKLLEGDNWKDWTRQPRTCHMQVLRQVLSPLGLWNCPAHRGVAKARIDEGNAFAGPEGSRRSVDRIAGMLDTFDASSECREVTCLYHDTNWWIENAITTPAGGLSGPVPDTLDYFL